jgi:hypothetical protein
MLLMYNYRYFPIAGTAHRRVGLDRIGASSRGKRSKKISSGSFSVSRYDYLYGVVARMVVWIFPR